jgi:tocopherol O-methyltransferase
MEDCMAAFSHPRNQDRQAATAAIRQHYDSLAFIYRTFWGDHIHHGLFRRGDETPEQAQLQMLEHCAQRAGVRPRTRALDVGCGHGGTALYLAQVYGCQVTGLTVSEKQVRLARENAARAGVAGRTRFAADDADSHDFGCDWFDLVWTMESSEHFHDKADYFRRAGGALRRGGVLLLTAWTGSMERPQVREVARAFLCPGLQTAEEYAAQMAAAGLRLRTQETLTSQVTRTWEICLQRAQLAGPVVSLLPRAAREFVGGIPVILEAYRSGVLDYSVLVAEK